LDDDLIADLKRQGARINSWGVGTNLITCRGCPALSGVYKLVAVRHGDRWEPRLKMSSNPAKTTDPGVKKIIRYSDAKGTPLGDVLYLPDEMPERGETVIGQDRQHFHHTYRLKGVRRQRELKRLCFKEGERIVAPESIETVKRRAREQIASLPEELKRLRNPEIYPVALSPKLTRLKEEILRENNHLLKV
jgi:nicotinate phosphoribosyltransferase